MRTILRWCTGGILGVAFLLAIVYVLPADARSTIGNLWWDTTHLAPEAALLITRDVWLGSRMADYHFDSGYEQEVYDIERADRLYQMALRYDATAAWLWYQRARIAFLRGQHERALQYLDIHQQLPDANQQAWYMRGLINGFLDRNEAALEAFLQFYEQDQTSWYIHNNLAWIYFKQGAFNKMREITATGLSLHPKNPWLLMGNAMAWHNLGSTATATARLQKARTVVNTLTADDWSSTYPGNDPAVATAGLAELRSTLARNWDLIIASTTLEATSTSTPR